MRDILLRKHKHSHIARPKQEKNEAKKMESVGKCHNIILHVFKLLKYFQITKRIKEETQLTRATYLILSLLPKVDEP